MKAKLLCLVILNFLLINVSLGQSCSPVNGTYDPSTVASPTDTTRNELNCHQYVRTALLNNGVNPNTGKFYSWGVSSPDTYNIASDARFVKVCNSQYAEAISFTNSDHSAIKLNSPYVYASTPGHNLPVYVHAPTQYSGGSNYNYYAVMPTVAGSATITTNQTKTYSFTNKNYIASISWSTSNPSLAITSSNGSTANVKAVCTNGSGSYYVIASITIKGSGETRTIKKLVTVSCGSSGTSCFDNTLDGNNLNTFNYVSPSTNHKVIMGQNRTWNKSWGNTTYWNTLNGGKEMNFSIPYGCATFTTYNGSCGTQTFTFCASSYRLASTKDETSLSEVTGPTPFKIYNLLTGKIIRKGLLENHNGKSPIESLPNGFYVLQIHDVKQKILINNN